MYNGAGFCVDLISQDDGLAAGFCRNCLHIGCFGAS